MALDLYFNFERSSNSSLFYRVTSSNPYTFNIKLSDELIPNGDLSEYYVQYSFNNASPARWMPDENGFFTLQKSIVASYPCISSIVVYVSSGENFPINTFQLSGAIVRHFPTIDYIAYPSLYVNAYTADYKYITSTNYTLSSRGLSFYGEGHTEVVNLSCNNYSNSGNTVKWLVGNSIMSLVSAAANGTVSSDLPVVASTSTATVTVTTEIGTYKKLPISLWATNSTITTAGPFITYRDSDGAAKYYPFFTSSLSANGSTEVNRITKGSISILPYPELQGITILDAPFDSSHFLLPFDYSAQAFVAVSDIKKIAGDALEEHFAGSKWEIEGMSRVGDWSVQTEFLSSVHAYKFKLKYDQDTGNMMLPSFKASAILPTTIFLNLTSYRECSIKLPQIIGQAPAPLDWKAKLLPTVNSLSAIVNPVPFDRIYTPKFYNLKGENVPFTIVTTPDYPLEVTQLTIKSANSPDTLVLSNKNPTGSMTFNVLGIADLSATAVLKNNISGTTYDTSLIYQDMVEILQRYDDDAEELYFHTATTPLNLTFPTQPRLSPNEWAIADTVNSILEKYYTTTRELIGRSRVYNQKNTLYGYLAPAEKVSVMKVPDQYEWYNPPHIWMDLDCTDGEVTDDTASWAVFESRFGELSSAWAWQDCGSRIKIDPSCFQKFCVQWNWRWRIKGASDVDVTWADTKAKNVFQKKWKWEKCTIDAVNINCDRTKWNVATVDVNAFPIPDSVPVGRCTIVDVDINKQTDQMVIAHKTEIHLIDKDYFCNHTARTAMADDLFSFQNIVGISTNSQGKVIVLDGTLPRVCVYTIDKNNFTPFSNWGSYGLKETTQGFRDPLDIHVDQYNSVFIADTGNACIKKFTLIGKPLMTITHEMLDEYPPLSICVDSQDNIHCLTSNNVVVFNSAGEYYYKYDFDVNMDGAPSKINVSANKEMVYITYQWGVAKHFRNGVFSDFVVKDIVCGDGYYLEGYNSLTQDTFRNVFVTVGDKILQIHDIQQIIDLKANIPTELYWSLDDLLIHKEEYIQPWVYLKAFHRLWDNIELLRNSIFYTANSKCKSFAAPTYQKEDLIIGQNEIVTNAVINRLSEQLWANIEGLIKYFDPECEN